jgi:hypothetical protein
MSLPILIVVVATTAGCGSSGSGGDVSKKYLNNEKLERAIEQSVLAQRHREVAVSCPPFVRIKKGATFNCTAATRRGTVRFLVRIKDDRGNVHYETVPR